MPVPEGGSLRSWCWCGPAGPNPCADRGDQAYISHRQAKYSRCTMQKASLAAVLGLALVAAASAGAPGPAWHQLAGYTFEQYKMDFAKAYGSMAEEAVRRNNFNAALARIRSHNADASKSWKMGVNQFTDLPEGETRAMLGYHKQLGALRRANPPSSTLKWESVRRQGADNAANEEASWLPSQVDWRKDGVVSDVKNQGMCGSCWAFAAAEALESQMALKTGYLYTLSVQEFVSCMPNERKCGGTGGCSGAIPQLAFDFALENGLVDEWSYAYQSFHGDDTNSENCGAFQKDSLAVGHVTGHYDLPENDQGALMEAVAFDGPVSVSVDASAWHTYEEGVFDGCNQTNPDINHAVQLVGYGTDKSGGDYWLVRNSWGPSWGSPDSSGCAVRAHHAAAPTPTPWTAPAARAARRR
eukprot:jgi/Tetstr1/434567/TSEL_023658.t1